MGTGIHLIFKLKKYSWFFWLGFYANHGRDANRLKNKLHSLFHICTQTTFLEPLYGKENRIFCIKQNL